MYDTMCTYVEEKKARACVRMQLMNVGVRVQLIKKKKMYTYTIVDVYE